MESGSLPVWGRGLQRFRRHAALLREGATRWAMWIRSFRVLRYGPMVSVLAPCWRSTGWEDDGRKLYKWLGRHLPVPRLNGKMPEHDTALTGAALAGVACRPQWAPTFPLVWDGRDGFERAPRASTAKLPHWVSWSFQIQQVMGLLPQTNPQGSRSQVRRSSNNLQIEFGTQRVSEDLRVEKETEHKAAQGWDRRREVLGLTETPRLIEKVRPNPGSAGSRHRLGSSDLLTCCNWEQIRRDGEVPPSGQSRLG